MIAATISFYGSEADLKDSLQKLLNGPYKSAVEAIQMPASISRTIMPLGAVVFNIAIASRENRLETEHIELSVSASRKGLIPTALLYKHINMLEQELISVVTTQTVNKNTGDLPQKAAVSNRKIIHIVLDKGDITEEQTLQLFSHINGSTTTQDIDDIFRVNNALQQADNVPAYWQDSFITGLFHYYTAHADTEDHLSLIKRIKEDGKVDEATELRLLMLINRKFDGVSDDLQEAILEEVHQSVLSSTDSNFIDDNRVEGAVDAEDIILLRRTIFGAGSDGGIGISRREAELLFRVDMDTAEAENHADWPEFFACAVKSYLLNCGQIINVINEDERVWLVSNLQRYSVKTEGLKNLHQQLLEDNIRLPKNVVEYMI